MAPGQRKNAVIVLDEEKGCRICWRPASGHFYGAFCCSACKMFFHRCTKFNLSFSCRREHRCFEKFTVLPKCAACRLGKCWKVGMRPTYEPPPVRDDTIFDLKKFLVNLVDMEDDRYQTMVSTYSTQNPTLDDVLTDRSRMWLVPKTADIVVSPHEWAFLDVYSRIVYFSRFAFFQQLRCIDQKRLFTYNYLRVGLLGGAMRTYRNGRDSLLTPDGQDVYPPQIRKLYAKTGNSKILDRICSVLAGKLIELKVTNEECQLLILIFFCNPVVPSLSLHAQGTLAEHQRVYNGHLFNYCLLKFRGYGPTRFGDLLSICTVMNKVNEDLQGVSMMLQMNFKNFPFKNLVDETFVKAAINRGDVQEIPDYGPETFDFS